MTIDWRPRPREFHLRNGRISYVLRVYEDGSLGHSTSGRRSPPAGRTATSARTVRRVLEPRRRPGRRSTTRRRAPATSGSRPSSSGRPDGSTVLDLVYAGHRIVAGKPPVTGAGSPGDLRRSRRRGGHARGHPRRRAERARGGPALHDLRATARSSPGARPSATAAAAPVQLRTAMSASLDLPDADWDLVRLTGAWARETPRRRARRLRPGPPVSRQRPRRLERPAQPVPRAAPPDDRRSAGRGVRVQPRLLRQLPRRGRGRPVRARPASGSASAPTPSAGTLEPGDAFVDPRGDPRLLGRGARRHERRAPPALSRPARARGPGATGRGRSSSTTGRRPTSTSTPTKLRRDRDRRRATSAIELFVLDDGWFGRARRRHDLARRLVRRPAQAAGRARRRSPRRSRRSACASGCGSSPRWSASDSRPVRGAPGLGGRRPRPAADGEPPAARPRHVPAGGRRPPVRRPVRGPRERADLVRQVGHEPDTSPSRTALGLPPERQGEFFHRYILGVYDLYRRLTTRFPDILFESCASGGGRFDPGMLAFAPQAWTSDDTDAVERLRIQWGDVAGLPAELDGRARLRGPEPPDRAGHADRRHGRRSRSSGCSATSWTRRALSDGGTGDGRCPGRVLQGPSRAVPARPVRPTAEPVRGGGNETAWMVVAPDRAHAIVGFYRVLNRPVPPVDRLRLRGLDPARVYRVSGWPCDRRSDRPRQRRARAAATS